MGEARIDLNCEECGTLLSFSAAQQGTIQECPHCFEFVDVQAPQLDPLDEISEAGNVDVQEALYVESAGQFLYLDAECGLPHPRWDEFYDEVGEAFPSSQLDGVYREAGKLWLEELVRVLPPGYEVSESHEFYLLSHPARTNAPFTLEFCEAARRTILDFLGGVADDDGYGKHVVLAFADMETYYSYITFFYPDGEFGDTGGMFIHDGYGHMVCVAGWSLHRIIAHEMTHALLHHLPLPLWLNEGVTQIAEDRIMLASWFQPSPKDLARIRAYFAEHGLDGFWNGKSFSSSDEGQELSYLLARIITVRLFLDSSAKFWNFVRAADSQDAGRSAYSAGFGGSLEELVGQYVAGRTRQAN